MIWVIFFWVCFAAILHSYLIYPLLVRMIARKKEDNKLIYSPGDNLPFISVIMSVHNEQDIIVEKVRSIYNTKYPEDKFEVLIGSDGSDDKTNEILHVFASDHEILNFKAFTERRGKPMVINELRESAMGEILVMTDAQVLFTPDTLFELVKHFRNLQIGLVGGNIMNLRTDPTGISRQEWTFMSREIRIKYYQGKIWGTMIGAYGACFAVRNECYRRVPSGYSVDDFFITMSVLEQKRKCILELGAVGQENVPNRLRDEFRRKIRISAGNFQNLKSFSRLLWPPWTGLSFSFFSHKVLRWLGPFILLMMIVSNALLLNHAPVYRNILLIQLILPGIPFIDFLLRKLGIHIVILRFITHFYSMNLALLAGFLKFLKGTKTNVWQPTRRTE